MKRLDKVLIGLFLVQNTITLYLASNLATQVCLVIFLVSSILIYSQIRPSKIVSIAVLDKEPSLKEIERECQAIEDKQFCKDAKAALEKSWQTPTEWDIAHRKLHRGYSQSNIDSNGKVELWRERSKKRKVEK
jgi:hypothetical protein